MWIAFTLFAAFMQAFRNALQSKLSANVSVLGVTLARFILAGPIALLYLLLLYWFIPTTIPDFSWIFLSYICAAALMQIIATALMVKLFKLQNYAVGAGLAKSEAVMAALIGSWFFGSTLAPLGWLGVLLGTIAVFILSGVKSIRQLNLPTVLLGLACGTAFALTSLWVREASITLLLPFPHSAAWVLLLVISLQTILLSLYVFCYQKSTFSHLWHHRKTTSAVSLTSCFGSIGWFSAMSLQHVAFVKTVGQIEVFFTLLIAVLFLKQPPKKQDTIGLILIAGAAILVMLPQ
ncbi:hypothetical protein PTD2_09858 [Pseudoalteromonas tunicata D2]|uniref:EamA domain-containing protein n=2 Tax=Pseudoalteromonas tunicata TaxID=314281 RepID=A4CE64_9GAMM|nr:hypothetical protein PTD2_09858 [Pseudoalteromonas tunicata D2]